MKTLKLLKPWRLPLVRLKLEVPLAPHAAMRTPAMEPAADDTTLHARTPGFDQRIESQLQRTASPSEPPFKHRAPSLRAIFASTASPHPGCPHLFS